MAVFKSVKGIGKTKKSLKSVLEYVTGKLTKDENEKCAYASGYNCSNDPKQAYKNFLITKELYDNEEGRQYKHHIQSFKVGEVTAEEAHKIAKEFVEKNYKGFEVLYTTHIDKNHIHNHFVINSVCRENGKKLRELNKNETKEKKSKNIELEAHEFILDDLKKSSDELCKAHNLSVIDRSQKSKSINTYDRKKYNAIKNDRAGKKESTIVKLAKAIKEVISSSKSKEDFIDKLSEKNIKTSWIESRKNITFEVLDTSEKLKKFRLSNLFKTFNDETFTKENIEQQIQNNIHYQQEQEQDPWKRKLDKEKLDREKSNSWGATSTSGGWEAKLKKEKSRGWGR